MPHYRVHRIRDHAGESFRWAPHTGGLAIVKPRDYQPGEEVEGANPYDIWKRLAATQDALRPGDLLESSTGPDQAAGSAHELWIAKYIGFEPARWFVPELRPAAEAPADLGQEVAASEVSPS